MGGHCIESEDFVIVVDKWDGSFLRRPGCKPHYFFLTHLHADHISGLTSTWSRTIYTSPFNAWLLPMRRNVKQILLKEVELNVTHTIRKANNDIAFQVTLIDANHCPGAVMFLFQGKFGNILYTGDFRYTHKILENPVLSPIIRNKELSVLYLDNTYAAPTCKFPSREKALQQVLKIIDENPDANILIGMRQLGKEEVLRAIALHINEKVCVSNQRFQILSKLEYEDVFTTDTTQSRIHAVELHTITQRHCQESTKTVSIKLTSMYECGNVEKQRGNIYVVPYSDHSSHDELKEFVDHLRPLKLYPISIPKIPKGTAVPGPWHRMSAVNCVVPEEILQLCGPASENGAPSAPPVIDLPLLQIKYHPTPKPVSVEKKSSSVTYIDEGMNFVPFDSLGSHLTNNNKARKHIKASWTRLAPKLLTSKGVKFESPEKNPEGSPLVAKAMDKSSSDILGPLSNKGDLPCDPSVKENSVIENDGVLVELPLSDDDYDMPSSASELIRQLNLSASESVNGVGCEDRKSECSSVITDLFEDTGNVRMTRNRSKCESPTKGVNDSKDSVSDISSSKRTTRSKASVTSVPVFSRPRTRLSHGSDIDSHLNNESPRKAQVVVRKSLRNSPNAQGLSPVSPKSAKNGLGRKSVSLESLPTKSTSKELKKASKEVKDADIFLSPGSPSKKGTKVTNDSRNNACKTAERIPSPTENVPQVKRVPVLETINVEEANHVQNDSSSMSIVEATNSVPVGSSNVVSGVQAVGTSSNASAIPTGSSTENCNVTVAASKKTVNGNLFLSNFNGIHINSPGRKRVPLSCDWDAAQEIVKKETEQALKALECLNQMKGFKTRNRSGPAAQRRLSADNIPKPATNKPASPGMRRRTASILSSMASTFSQQPATKEKEATTPSQPAHCVQGISPILPDKETRSPRKAKAGSPAKMGSSKKSPGPSKGKVPHLYPESVTAGQSTNLSSVVKIEDTIDTDVVVSQNADSEGLPSSISLVGSTEPVLLAKAESFVNNDSVEAIRQQSSTTPVKPHMSAVVSNESDDTLNQGLFLTDETLATASSSSKKEFKQPRRTYYKRQTEVNVNLMKLKMDFAMSRKGPKRLSLPSRLSFLRKDFSNSPRQESALQSKDKVQDWKKKISLRLRKSPQRRYRFKSPNKLRENAKRTLASILRSGRNLGSSQGYQGDVEDCTELSQPISDTRENSGYMADHEGATQAESTQPSSVPTEQRQTRSSHQSTLNDSSASEDSKVGILNEVRRSSRLSKEDLNCFQVPSRPVKSLPKQNSKQENSKANSKGTRAEINPPQKRTGTSPLDNTGGSSAGSPVVRFSDRLSEKSKMMSSKGTETAQKSPNILSLMADAFKNSPVSSEAPSTANILCSMAENFKKLDEATRVSPSLSIQLVSSKAPVSIRPPKDRNSTDWGVQITRVDGASSKSQKLPQNPSSGGLSIRNAIPKSLSIEIIPDSDEVDVAPRKGPSPPTVTISPEVIDLASDPPESEVGGTQSTIHSLPMAPGPRFSAQGRTRWPQLTKSEILPPPQAVWKEKRSSTQTSDNVIIDIQTQEDPQKVPHCPVHCTCGAALRQGTCMGTMRNLIEEDADCLYEVPLSPEDFEESGAMLALGRGWIESCFEDPEDRDEFFQSYEDILPTLSDLKQRRTKSLSASENSKSAEVQPAPQTAQPVRRVLSLASAKPTTQSVKQAPAAAAASSSAAATASSSAAATASSSAASQRPQQQTQVKKQAATSSQTKAFKPVPKSKQTEEPKKKPASCLKEIEKKIIAYNDEKSKKESERKSLPSRRTSSQSTSSSNSASRPRSSKQSQSPAAPPPPKVKPTTSKRKLNAPNASNDPKEKKHKVNTSSSGSESPETKKPRCNELDRLSDIGKNNANRRYRVSVRRSLDHLMTRQKLRSDRRVKTSNSSRS
ncbi:pneumococcal serine-rich repeat protein-like isoform X2 [Thrips palmi]|uniref:5' exonuclease Apollo n=1 Tax=Thrips palmi TaxID=161013 RepID=A0A6P8ZCZ0_THRPL|nr:pneumococcal serine-rich repeat protein-like isoform X2 [Thrips palmi]